MTLAALVILGTGLTVVGPPSVATGSLYEIGEDHAVTTLRRLSGEDLQRYSGVGALHCRSEGRERVVTAFLVGAVDVVVTVAHAVDAADGSCSIIQEGDDATDQGVAG